VNPALSRRSLLRAAGAGALTTALPPLLSRPALADDEQRTAYRDDPAFAHAWTELLYDSVMPEDVSPPAASRIYALAAIAAYEALVPGMPHHVSLAGSLNALSPAPAAPRGRLDWPTVATGAYARTTDSLLAWRVADRSRVAALRDEQVAARRAQRVPEPVLARSLAHGDAVARHVLAWAATDGHAEAMAAAPSYVPPTGPGLWRSTPPNFRRAVEPYAGSVRTMVLTHSSEVEPNPMPATYDPTPGSPFWLQAQRVFDVQQSLTEEQKAIARFWTDNPVFSGLPSGHWMMIACQLERRLGLDLGSAAEVRARLGVTLFDAFHCCWAYKYRTNLLRPVTYIRDHFPGQAGFSTLINTPQFPEYTSGHSVTSQASARVLVDLLGEVPYTDVNRASGNLPARSYTSVLHAAQEAAGSRLFGGIHYPMGIEQGLIQGDRVADVLLSRLTTRRGARRDAD
jgi:hypothetical protein